MQPLVSMRRASRRHPLFDDASDYGLMHATMGADLKMQGCFCYLLSKADQAGIPVPTASTSRPAAV